MCKSMFSNHQTHATSIWKTSENGELIEFWKPSTNIAYEALSV